MLWRSGIAHTRIIYTRCKSVQKCFTKQLKSKLQKPYAASVILVTPTVMSSYQTFLSNLGLSLQLGWLTCP
jgi:hypothetical protein